MTWEAYKDVKVKPKGPARVHERFSVTAHVLSMRRCSRQYGFHAERGFVPSQPTQEFVGTVVHQVLDRAYSHYKGRPDPSTKGQLPDDEDIAKYFEDVANALKAHHVRAISPDLKELWLKRVQAFNRIERETLYPKIIDTEHRLQADRTDYLLYGVVDVLKGTESGAPEIWDYKGSKVPKSSTKDGEKRLRDYKFQMQVYAELYRQRNGVFPESAKVYFLGEIDEDATTRPKNALLDVSLKPDEITEALKEFDKTVGEIRAMRAANGWPAPDEGSATAGRETCDLCDIRWTCKAEGSYYLSLPRKYP